MSFFGIENQMAPGYRAKRFTAFLIDMAVVVLLWFVFYKLIGKPDVFAVMDGYAAAAALPPEEKQAATYELLRLFDAFYIPALIIWFGYEAAATVLLRGKTIGKLLMGLQIVPLNPNQNVFLSALSLVLRSAVKMLSLYLIQGLPFLICCLTIFGNQEGRSGFDVFAKTQTVDCKNQPAHSL